MTRPLRRRHLWTWVVLAVLLPAIYMAGLLVRRSTTPPNPDLRWERYK